MYPGYAIFTTQLTVNIVPTFQPRPHFTTGWLMKNDQVIPTGYEEALDPSTGGFEILRKILTEKL